MNSLNDKFWEEIVDLIPRLTLYAHHRLRHLSWRGVSSAPDPHDLVQDAIHKTIDGKRPWRRDRATIYQHLKGVISSEISHILKSSEYNSNIVTIDRLKQSKIEPTYSEDLLTEKKQTEDFIDFIEEKDERLKKMAMLMIYDGLIFNMELSQALDLTVREVENQKKRLKRMLNLYLNNTSSAKSRKYAKSDM